MKQKLIKGTLAKMFKKPLKYYLKKFLGIENTWKIKYLNFAHKKNKFVTDFSMTGGDLTDKRFKN